MSLIGSLEQLDLANILRRLEIFAKTGLLAVKRQDTWVEFYFRQGQLVCLGPIRTNATLVDRLLQAQLLSFQALPQVMSVINVDEPNETRVALALINEGYLSREILRAWSAYETSQVLQSMSTWTAGEIYFEEDCLTPANRLLVALSISTILDTLPTTTPVNLASPVAQASSPSQTMTMAASSFTTEQFEATQLIATPTALTSSSSDNHATTPGSLNAAQLIDVMPTFATQAPIDHVEGAGMLNLSRLLEDDLPFGTASSTEHSQQAAPNAGFLGSELNITSTTQSTLTPPQQVFHPLPPARIDTSFMTPTMILTPVDLSSLREQNPQVQLTPDQWSLFALIDGQTSLQALCSVLRASSEQVCTVAGELMAIGLVTPLVQTTNGSPEFSSQPAMPAVPFPRTAHAPTWAPPQPKPAAPMPAATPLATQAQWGNGDTGATFMVGSGWVIASKPTASQSNPTSVPAGGYR